MTALTREQHERLARGLPIDGDDTTYGHRPYTALAYLVPITDRAAALIEDGHATELRVFDAHGRTIRQLPRGMLASYHDAAIRGAVPRGLAAVIDQFWIVAREIETARPMPSHEANEATTTAPIEGATKEEEANDEAPSNAAAHRGRRSWREWLGRALSHARRADGGGGASGGGGGG